MGRKKEIRFLTKNYHNPESRIFQQIPMNEKFNNPYENNRLEEINRSRNGVIIDILKSGDTVEMV